MKDGGEVLHIMLRGRNEDCRIIGIEGGPQNGGPPSKLVKQPMNGGKLEDLGDGVYSKDKKER
jgi:hypothetical protein